jgi:polyisoprenoid-binding protein YceI
MKILSNYVLFLAILFSAGAVNGQSKYFTRGAQISFLSQAPMETIEGVSNTVNSAILPSDGRIEFAVLIKSFNFEKKLMQEHFNENYLESDKYPKATFKGTLTNLNKINFSKEGTYPATVSGNLTIHGITKPITTNGTITVKNKTLLVNCSFNVLLSDYKIEIPSLVKDKVNNKVAITVKGNYSAL